MNPNLGEQLSGVQVIVFQALTNYAFLKTYYAIPLCSTTSPIMPLQPPIMLIMLNYACAFYSSNQKGRCNQQILVA